ncbi:MAG: glycosyltransferase family 2 protein [Planctomycetes bacterium]|nr:glycosyltransferase family 2 protein [Planctomycetota bacterium]MCB9869549.1 glycosyltransferase family 2 protein [Planctomycetota bacterium]MCB9889936.1 glycosyltransferase family 2 protein [Planctomycetota bacterium]
MIDVSVVVVTWNSAAEIEGCLRSVLAQRGALRQEVLVVDNASGDGTAALVREHFPEVTLIANDDNRGFAAGNNQAFARARGRYVLCLNPDTVVVDRAIERCVEYADQHPRIGVLGCQVWRDEQRIQRTCFAFPGPWSLLQIALGMHRLAPRSRLLGSAELGFWDRRSARDVDVVTGMFMLVRREALAAVGPMDEDYFVYAEEADWCFRMWRAGWVCSFWPGARIVHLDGGGKSTRQIRVRMFVQQQKSLVLWNRKNRGRWAGLCARAIFSASMAVRGMWWMVRAVAGGGAAARDRRRCAFAALRYHLFGIEPEEGLPAAPRPAVSRPAAAKNPVLHD